VSSSELAGELERSRGRTEQRSWRGLAIEALGLLTALAGLVWAVAQPYRITLLHPRGEGFWNLAVQPPLLVIAVGLLFAFLIAPGIVEDVEAAGRER
jgi:hypothetical protein